MSRAAELRKEAAFAERQENQAVDALLKLPERTRHHYEAQYAAGPPLSSKQEGEFVGLCCRWCNTWIECGHEDDCPVAELEALYKENP